MRRENRINYHLSRNDLSSLTYIAYYVIIRQVVYDGFDEKNSLPYQVMVRPRGVEEVEVAGSVAPSREM